MVNNNETTMKQVVKLIPTKTPIFIEDKSGVGVLCYLYGALRNANLKYNVIRCSMIDFEDIEKMFTNELLLNDDVLIIDDVHALHSDWYESFFNYVANRKNSIIMLGKANEFKDIVLLNKFYYLQ